MGTSALVRVFNERKKVTLALYMQHDGYPASCGRAIAEFLEGLVIVNGMSSRDPPKIANGMDCLAAQLVKAIKDGPGGVYVANVDADPAKYAYAYDILPPEPRDASGCARGSPIMRIASDDAELFLGRAEDFWQSPSGQL